MAASGSASTREQLRAALAAAGITVTDEELAAMLPGYEGLLSGAARLRALDLGETEPAVTFRLPVPDSPR
jgi:hypothetical protein